MRLNIKLNLFVGLFIFFISCKEEPNPPTVSTIEISEITANSAISGGTIVDDGGAPIISNGVCWNISKDPTIENTKTSESEKGFFTSYITDLTPNSVYYVRAFATNSTGTSYGSSISFTTLGDKPLIRDESVNNIRDNSVTLSCSINMGHLNSTVVFEWGTTASYGNSIILNQNHLTGTNDITVSTDLSSLQSQTTYNFRIKVTNDLGTT